MDHGKPNVYRVTLELVTRIGAILKSKAIDRSLRDQLVRSSTSILLNIAEGTGKRSQPARRRYKRGMGILPMLIAFHGQDAHATCLAKSPAVPPWNPPPRSTFCSHDNTRHSYKVTTAKQYCGGW